MYKSSQTFESPLEEKLKSLIPEEIYRSPKEMKKGQKQLEKLYKKVSKIFGIKKGEIEVKYGNPESEGFGIFLTDESETKKERKFIFKPVLTAGKDLSDYTPEEKEAAVAHEIGHYLDCKYLIDSSFQKHVLVQMIRSGMNEGNITVKKNKTKPSEWDPIWSSPLEELFEDLLYQDDDGKLFIEKHKARWIKKEHTKNEISADNQAWKKGYGEDILNILEKYAPYETKRIENLKQKLKDNPMPDYLQESHQMKEEDYPKFKERQKRIKDLISKLSKELPEITKGEPFIDHYQKVREQCKEHNQIIKSINREQKEIARYRNQNLSSRLKDFYYSTFY